MHRTPIGYNTVCCAISPHPWPATLPLA